MAMVYQHVPGFVEAERKHAEVDTLEAVLALPWVNAWEDTIDINGTDHRFKGWARSGDHLMAVFSGEFWWVVALVRPPAIMNALPIWEEPHSSTPEA